jgi:hypothetical protein
MSGHKMLLPVKTECNALCQYAVDRSNTIILKVGHTAGKAEYRVRRYEPVSNENPAAIYDNSQMYMWSTVSVVQKSALDFNEDYLRWYGVSHPVMEPYPGK